MSHFDSYRELIEKLPVSVSDRTLNEALLMSSEGDISTYYAPFDYINARAKIVIIGITPGLQQARNSLIEARKLLAAGVPVEEARRRAKETASFSGGMRNNLTAMLDHIGIHTLMGIKSSSELFSTESHLAHFTSALRYPVFLKGGNYNGNPKITKYKTLVAQIESHLKEELLQFGPDTVFVPLGPKVSEAVAMTGVAENQVLHGLPHPSPASGERVAYFLGRKEKHMLSKVTNGDSIDAAKAGLIAKISALRS